MHYITQTCNGNGIKYLQTLKQYQIHTHTKTV